MFSLARIAGGALIVAGEVTVDSNPNVDLFIAAYLLFHAGLAILMLAAIGFLGLACVLIFCAFWTYTDTYLYKLEANIHTVKILE